MNRIHNSNGGTGCLRLALLLGLGLWAMAPLWAAEAKPTPKSPAEVCDPNAPVKPQPESTKRMIARLAGISRDIDPFAMPYFGGKTADLVRRKFSEARNPGERASMQWRYATALLNDGRSEEALQAIDEMARLLADNGLSPKPDDVAKIKLLRAICWLRLGEQQNCQMNHTSESCLFPILPSGVHRRTEGGVDSSDR